MAKYIQQKSSRGYREEKNGPVYDVYKCSVCGAEHYVPYKQKPVTPICPNCLHRIDEIIVNEGEHKS